MKCIVYDEDKFTKELIISFIEKTDHLVLIKDTDRKAADIIFVDAALFDGDYLTDFNPNAKVVIISSNQKFVHSFFQNEITDYFNKSEISYSRFLTSLEKVRHAFS